MKKEKKVLLILVGLTLIFSLIALILFNDLSFTFAGIAVILLAITIGYYFKNKEEL